MKLAYLSASTIPSRLANSVQVMKMCQAFSQLGMMTCLYVPDMPADALTVGESCHSRYGAARVFEIECVWWSKLFGRLYVSGFLAPLLRRLPGWMPSRK
ncbi:MAG: hypothetical protein F9K30_00540 [Dechloromonas sp.]|nr:MAG: hypothetical protein F9K30_00540 [Dechloromonas sp.]